MPLRKLDDCEELGYKQCLSPEHNPPMNMYLDPGTYEYTCPSCGAKVIFIVPRVTCMQ